MNSENNTHNASPGGRLCLNEIANLITCVANQPRPVIAIVCRPEAEERLRRMAREESTCMPYRELLGMPYEFGGIKIFPDCKQKTEAISFRDDRLLRLYLNRNEGPEALERWVRAYIESGEGTLADAEAL